MKVSRRGSIDFPARTEKHHIRDQDIFNKRLHENYPDTLAVGPCSMGGGQMGKLKVEEVLLKIVSKKMGTERLLKGSMEPMNVSCFILTTVFPNGLPPMSALFIVMQIVIYYFIRKTVHILMQQCCLCHDFHTITYKKREQAEPVPGQYLHFTG